MLRRRRWLLPSLMAIVGPLVLGVWTLTAVSAATQSPSPSPSGSGAAASPGASASPAAGAAGASPSASAGAASPGASGSPGTSASGALPGDPQNGATLYNSAGCTACHGAGLEGGIGPKLSPIQKLPDTKDPLNPQYLITTITQGKSGVGGFGAMPPKGGDTKLNDKDIADIAAFIIQTNKNPGATPLGPVELARSNVFWISTAVLAMLLITYLLARYNMRWIARRAALRREG
ncbi:cytochrome c [Candidatus Nephthysia bennettiae]|uniref:Cytochrome c n=1 Tax=Candidatus Nephthysia bennettiae TaxID=3127016 RepID=A0A934KA74_9BACT|nr:cytochrome c [Candidatus Dormibacteraeota bacterium]MBJ7612336.1 cytochrome c [Candidatus Dormibacteraeota bacterium]